MLARVLVRRLKSPTAGLVIEAVLIGGVGFFDIGMEPAVMVVAFAMGLQASSITSFAGSAVSTVVVTSTLARTADAAVDRLWPGTGITPPSATMSQLLTLTWTGYLVGAIAGGLLIGWVAYPLLVPAALLLLLLALKD